MLDFVSRFVSIEFIFNFIFKFITQTIYWHYLQSEPSDGDLCTKCWQQVVSFHTFYTNIEAIHAMIFKAKDTLNVEPLKIHDENSSDEQTFDDNAWSLQCVVDELDQKPFGGFHLIHFTHCNGVDIKHTTSFKLTVYAFSRFID